MQLLRNVQKYMADVMFREEQQLFDDGWFKVGDVQSVV